MLIRMPLSAMSRSVSEPWGTYINRTDRASVVMKTIAALAFLMAVSKRDAWYW